MRCSHEVLTLETQLKLRVDHSSGPSVSLYLGSRIMRTSKSFPVNGFSIEYDMVVCSVSLSQCGVVASSVDACFRQVADYCWKSL